MTTITGTIIDQQGRPSHCKIGVLSLSTPSSLTGGVIIATTKEIIFNSSSDGSFSIQLEPGDYKITYYQSAVTLDSVFQISVPSGSSTIPITDLITTSLVYTYTAPPNTIWNGQLPLDITLTANGQIEIVANSGNPALRFRYGGVNYTVTGAGTFADLTEATSSVLTIVGGVGSVHGSGTTIQVKQASSSQSGFLSSTDWTTFNNKLSSLTTGNLTENTSSILTITGGTGAVIGSGATIQVKLATTTVDGYLSHTDWNTFNAKESALTFSSPLIRTTNTISIQDAAADGSTKGAAAFATNDFNASSGVISIDYTNGQAATGSVKGFLTAADWTTFNSKQAALGYSPVNKAGDVMSGSLYFAMLGSSSNPQIALQNDPNTASIYSISGDMNLRTGEDDINILPGDGQSHPCVVKFGADGSFFINCSNGASINSDATSKSITIGVPSGLVVNGYSRQLDIGGTIAPIVDIQGTWIDTSGDETPPYTAFRVNLIPSGAVGPDLTNKLIDLQFGGETVFSVELGGVVIIPEGAVAGYVLTCDSSGRASWSNPSSGGTVTSVGMTVPGFLSVAGSPVTTAGTLAVTLATQTANTIFAGPTTGSADAPTFRAMVSADLPSTITGVTWHGTAVSEIYGGTNQTSYALGDILYASATNTLSKLAGNTVAVRKFLKQTGTGSISAAPAWDTLASGDVTGALGFTPENPLTFSSPLVRTVNTISIPAATSSVNGYLSSTDWSTFNNKQATISGTTNRITVSSNVVDISASYVGQSSITTLGTIATGIWHGTAVAEGFGGTNQSTYTLGDTLYASASNTLSKLSGNTTTTKKFLRQTGNGSISAAPAWDTVTSTDVGLGNVENTALSTWAGSTNLTTLGTIATGTWNATAIADGKIASALTGKTYNALTLTAASIGFSIAGGTTSKTLTISNTLTFAGTDSSTLNIGAGGTLGSAAFTASSAYVAASTYSAKGVLVVGTGSGTFSALTVGTNGFALVADSAQTTGVKWAAVSASPAGSNTEIQFNNSGVFGSSGQLTFDGTTFNVFGNFGVVASGAISADGGIVSTDGSGILTMVALGFADGQSIYTITSPQAALVIKVGADQGFSISSPIELSDGVCFTAADDAYANNTSMEFRASQYQFSAITGGVTINPFLKLTSTLKDASNSAGSSGYILTSTGTATAWVAPSTVVKTIPLFDHFADAGNTTTGETDLYSDTIAAGQLATNGDKLYSHYSGTFVQSATATRTLRVYFGGTKIFDSGALTANIASAAWQVEVNIIRVDASTVRCDVSTVADGVAVTVTTTYTSVGSLTLANTQILKVTGQAGGTGAATNDIVAKIGTVQWISHA